MSLKRKLWFLMCLCAQSVAKEVHACEVVSGTVYQLESGKKLVMNERLILAHRSIWLTFITLSIINSNSFLKTITLENANKSFKIHFEYKKGLIHHE